MRKSTIYAIEKEIQNLKKVISMKNICITILDESDRKGVFLATETVYRSRAEPVSTIQEIQANTIQEAAAEYRFPEECDNQESILFIINTEE